MKVTEVIELMKQYASCPACGSGVIGGREGFVNIGYDVFTRGCQCGFRCTILMNGATLNPSTHKRGRTVNANIGC